MEMLHGSGAKDDEEAHPEGGALKGNRFVVFAFLFFIIKKKKNDGVEKQGEKAQDQNQLDAENPQILRMVLHALAGLGDEDLIDIMEVDAAGEQQDDQQNPSHSLVMLVKSIGDRPDIFFGQTGLSESDFEVLCALAESSATSVRAMELRCGLEWEKSRLSHQLRRMQQRGLVDRAGCDDDGRASMVQITAVGRDVLGRAREVNDALVQRYVVETLGASRLDALGEIAGLVLAALDDETGPAHH